MGTIIEDAAVPFHARRASGGQLLLVEVADSQEPDCFGYGALGGSVLRVHGVDIIGGAGRYEGVTGTMPKNKEVPGGSDVVMNLRLKSFAPDSQG